MIACRPLPSSQVSGLPGGLARGLPPAWPARRLHAASAAAASDAPAGGHSPQAGDLVQWVQRAGGSVSGVAVRRWNGADGGSGFGLQAAAAVPAGAPLVTLPPAAHLTYGAATDPNLLDLIARVPEELWGAKLALQLLAKRLEGGAGSHDSYVRALPRGFPGLPMFFPPEAVQALEYPPVTSQITRRCRWLLGFSADVLAPARGAAGDPFGGALVDAGALGWALGAVTSRAFRTRGPAHPAALLPLIDMVSPRTRKVCTKWLR